MVFTKKEGGETKAKEFWEGVLKRQNNSYSSFDVYCRLKTGVFELNERKLLFDRCREYIDSLVKIPSPSGDENDIGTYIAEELVNMGLKTEKVPTCDGRFCVYAEICGGRPGCSCLLVGHIDTVEPSSGWNTDPFIPCQVGDRLYGLGACDMKAGVAMILALASVAVRRKDFPGVLKFAFVPDEEAISEGVRALISNGIKADYALMPEPNFEPVVIGAPGKVLLKISIRGKSAHGARPNEGINSITEAGRFLMSLEKAKTLSHSKLGSHPFVPLKIEGGYKRYSLTVPDYCEIIVSKQLVPGEDKAIVLRQLYELAEGIASAAEFQFSFELPYYPPYEIDENSSYVRRFKESFRSVIKREPKLGYGASVSDANCLVAMAEIPVIEFGPMGGNIHGPNEWVSLCSVEKCLQVYAELMIKEG